MLVKWMDSLLAPTSLRQYVYAGRHRAPRTAKPAGTSYAGPADILIR